jgi:hypothetical protein
LRFLFRDFGDDNFENHWLTIRNQSALAARQLCQEGQFHPLHRCLNAAQCLDASKRD